MHIAHGMHGLIVVEPPEGLAAVDREYYLMQSEFYTDRGARLGYTQLKDAGPRRSSVSARSAPWTPRSRPRKRFASSWANIGPNLVSSFHVIGEIFDVVYVEGLFDLRNQNLQSTVVPAGGAVGVEFRADVPGTYPPVDHSICWWRLLLLRWGR